MQLTAEVLNDINDVHIWVEATKEKLYELLQVLPQDELRHRLEHVHDSLVDAHWNVGKAIELTNVK